MRPPRLGRYLAPLALVAVIVATALVVNSGLGTTTRPKPTATTRLPAIHRHITRKRFYTIRTGDTLSSISVKTGVSVGELQALNPSLTSNPNALQTGQRLRLR
jgi:Tfp pilus assembly protein FimV